MSFEDLAEEVERENDALQAQRIVQKEAEAFVQRLRARLKEARGRTRQAEVAKRMGLSHQSQVSRIESGEAGDLTLETLYRYARALGLVPVISLVPAWEATEGTAMPVISSTEAFPTGISTYRLQLIEQLHERSLEQFSRQLADSYAELGEIVASATVEES